jgi:hypothetical protein
MGSGSYKFNPHLSLLYKDLPEETKRAAAATVRLPAERVEFNGLDLVRVPTRIETRGDIESWETVASCWLRGPL